MSLDPVTALVEAGMMAISRIWPDPVQQAAEVRKLKQLQQDGDIAKMSAHVNLMLAQIEVNKESAKHPSVFVSGARPAAIWVGVFSMSWSGIIHPLLTWVWAFASMEGNPPPLIESTVLGAIVTGLLGIGSMRSYDKTKGTSKDSI